MSYFILSVLLFYSSIHCATVFPDAFAQKWTPRNWLWPNSLVLGCPHFWQRNGCGICRFLGVKPCAAAASDNFFSPPRCCPGHTLNVRCSKWNRCTCNRYGRSTKRYGRGCRCSRYGCCSRCMCSSSRTRYGRRGYVWGDLRLRGGGGGDWRRLALRTWRCLSGRILRNCKLEGWVSMLDLFWQFWQYGWELFRGHQSSSKRLNVLLQDLPLLPLYSSIVPMHRKDNNYYMCVKMIMNMKTDTNMNN